MVPPQQISAGQTLAKVYLKLIVDKVEIGSLVSVLQRDGEAFDKEIKDYLEGSHNIKNIEKLSYEDANGYHVLNANVGVFRAYIAALQSNAVPGNEHACSEHACSEHGCFYFIFIYLLIIFIYFERPRARIINNI